jgi:hypothetical protein
MKLRIYESSRTSLTGLSVLSNGLREGRISMMVAGMVAIKFPM